MATASKSRVWRTIPLMLIMALFCPSARAKVIYVDDDANAANNGSSWANAYLCLQDALAAAQLGDEIQVAKGIYKPDQHFVRGRFPRVLASGYRTATFQLKNGVAIRGGYAGFGEQDPYVRDIELHETILSGDLNGNDRLNFVNNYENSYHVVTGNGTDETAVLDGFIITAGNANGNQPHHEGGGMLNDSGSPTVNNCTFSGNSGEHCGGMLNRNCTAVVTDCTFTGNSAQIDGGGMNNDVGSSIVVTNCTFTGNLAEDGGGMFNCPDCSPIVANCTFNGNSANIGGGMCNRNSTPVVTDCIFTSNSAEAGGGMFNDQDSNPKVTNCTFSGNSANTGGGMFNQNCTAVVTDCIFTSNSAEGGGGGMTNDSNGNPKVTNCTFTGNSAEDGGGGMFNFWDSSPTVANCTFNGNSAIRGGGMFNGSKGNPIITNCTFSGNTAVDGGGVWSNVDCSPMLTNCILWGNTATSGPQLALYENSSVAIDYCDLQGGLPGIDIDPSSFVTWGLGNTDADPLFVNAANADYHLQAGSPCINAGDNSAIPESVVTDLDGNPRTINGIVDMGAYEYRSQLRSINPIPADGATDVTQMPTLRWTAGERVLLHDVYFGTDEEAVRNANMHLPEYKVTQDLGSESYESGKLDWNTTYYWRIDEFDGAVIHKGEIWSFRTMPELDPNLIGGWKFDEGSGTIAYDSSGNGNDGTFNGNPQWVPGHFNYALEFDGSGDWLDCGEDPSLQITDAVTVSAWIKLSATGIDQKVGSNQNDIAGGYKMTVFFDNKVEFEIRTSGNTPILNRDVGGGTVLQQDVWYHIAGVYSQKGNYIRTYVDGNFDRELVTAEALGASLGPFRIGCEPFEADFQDHHFNGVMDDIRIYNQALTEGEILGVMEDGEEWPFAFNPEPANGATHSDSWVTLSWSPGISAISHDVYFGDNRDNVDTGTGETFKGNQTETWFNVGSVRSPYLVPGTTYYWRIDEVNTDGTTYKGNIWSFSRGP